MQKDEKLAMAYNYVSNNLCKLCFSEMESTVELQCKDLICSSHLEHINNIKIPSCLFCKKSLDYPQVAEIQAEKFTNEKLEIKCDLCEINSSNFYCNDRKCEYFLCEKCHEEFHLKYNVNKNHRVIKLESLTLEKMIVSNKCFTRDHNDYIEFYCQDCNLLICQKCFISHKDNKSPYKFHSIIESNDYSVIMNENLTTTARKCLKKIEEIDQVNTKINEIVLEIEKNENESENQIDKLFEILNNSIEKRKEKLIQELKNKSEIKKLKLLNKLKKNESISNITECIKNLADRLLKSDNVILKYNYLNNLDNYDKNFKSKYPIEMINENSNLGCLNEASIKQIGELIEKLTIE
jgi:hypothetical protein